MYQCPETTDNPHTPEPTPAYVPIVLPASDWQIFYNLIEYGIVNAPFEVRESYRNLRAYFVANYVSDFQRGKWSKAVFSVLRLDGEPLSRVYTATQHHTLRDALSNVTRINSRPGADHVGVFFNRQAVREEGLGL